MNYCTITNGYAVIFQDGANATIRNSTIQNNSYGILCYSSSPLITNNIITGNAFHGIQSAFNSNPRIENNVITKNNISSGAGVYLYSGSGYVNSNTITGFNVGLYPTSGSYLAGWSDYYSTPSQNNIVQSNMYGIGTYDQSYAFLGYNDGTVHGGNNWIEGNVAYDLSVGDNTSMYAEGDWFGVDYTPTSILGQDYWVFAWSPLYQNPWPSKPLPGNDLLTIKKEIIPAQQQSILVSNQSLNEDKIFRKAITAQMKQDYLGAFNAFTQFFSSSVYSQPAMILTKYLYRDSKDKRILSYMEDLLTKPAMPSLNEADRPLAMNVLASMYEQEGDFVKSIALCDKVIKNYPNTLQARKARIHKIYYSVKGLQDYQSANLQLNELCTLYKDGDDIEMIKNYVTHSTLSSGSSIPAVNVLSNRKQRIINTPSDFSLSQNYPNPFNPVTRIEYALPQPGLVYLSVYDLLGREVAKLVNENKDAGYYQAIFDGSNLASGMYLCRLQAGSYVATKKMILQK